jgi:hypothetical protein
MRLVMIICVSESACLHLVGWFFASHVSLLFFTHRYTNPAGLLESMGSTTFSDRLAGNRSVDSGLTIDQQSFDRLFALLTPGSAIGEAVWDILMLLPPSQAFVSRVQSLDKLIAGKWDALFDTSSSYKVLYALQVIDQTLAPNTTSASVANMVHPRNNTSNACACVSRNTMTPLCTQLVSLCV